MVLTPDKHVVMTAPMICGSDVDILTVKCDPAGNQEWAAVFSNSNLPHDYPTALVVDLAGNVYVTGYSRDSNDFFSDYVTIKYDALGNQVWVAIYNFVDPASPCPECFSRRDRASAITLDTFGHVIVTGWSERHNPPGNDSDYMTILYDAGTGQRSTDWADVGFGPGIRRFNGPAGQSDFAVFVAADALDFVTVTGHATGVGTGFDITTIQYTDEGNVNWIRQYDGPAGGDDLAVKMTMDEYYQIHIIGTSAGSGTGQDYVAIRYSHDGFPDWINRYDGPANADDFTADMALIEDPIRGTVTYLTGRSWGGATEGNDFATLAYEQFGGQLWAARHDGGTGASPPQSWDEKAFGICADAAGNAYVTGAAPLPGGNGSSSFVITVKYDPDGNRTWLTRWPPAPQTGAWAAGADAVVDDNGNVYVCGDFHPYGDFRTKIVLLKYSQPAAPSINQQPASQAVCTGGPVILTVSAAGGPPVAYQWRRNGVDLVNGGNISGAASPTLTIQPAALADAGAYDVRVSNPGGSVTSDSATVTVVAAGSGDVNGDGSADGRDIADFIQVMLNGGPVSAALCACDINQDGSADLMDVPLFANVLVGS
jgi:hypothetical protein